MAWVSTLPDDPIVAASWRRVAERREAEAAAREAAEARRAAQERAWWLAAVAARAGRYCRDIDEVLARSETRNDCDCGFCVRCRVGLGDLEYSHSAPTGRVLGVRSRPEPDHGPAARFAGEIEWSHHFGQILDVR